MGYYLCPEPLPLGRFGAKRPNDAACVSLRSLEFDVFFLRVAAGWLPFL